MRRFLQELLFEIAYYIEIFISVILALILVGFSVSLLGNSFNIFIQGVEFNSFFHSFINQIMTLAIGVELIKMLVKHTPGTVLEVLVFAVARQLLTHHDNSLDLAVGIVSLFLLFLIRKYLFTTFDETSSVVVRASDKIKIVNILARVKIPSQTNETLREYMVRKLAEADKTVAIGASVYLKDFALRVDSMHGDKITRVEIIRALH